LAYAKANLSTGVSSADVVLLVPPEVAM